MSEAQLDSNSLISLELLGQREFLKKAWCMNARKRVGSDRLLDMPPPGQASPILILLAD